MSHPPLRDAVGAYLNQAGKHKLLSREDEQRLFRVIAQDYQPFVDRLKIRDSDDRKRLRADPKTVKERVLAVLTEEERIQFNRGYHAAEKVVKANLRMVVCVAKKFLNRGIPYEDLLSHGTMGVWRAIQKFDIRKGNKFSTYCFWWIRQAITRAIAEESRTIRLPVHVTEKMNLLRRRTSMLAQKLGRTPSYQEVATYYHEQDPTRTLEYWQNFLFDVVHQHATSKPFSLNGPSASNVGDRDVQDWEYYAKPQEQEDMYESLIREDRKKLIADIFSQLNAREARVLSMTYGLDGSAPLSAPKIAKIEKVSKQAISAVKTHIYRKLRSRLGNRLPDVQSLEEYL